MMMVSQKARYALRATFELARRKGAGPVPSGEIASVQAIPPRFLELILNQLVSGGVAQSRRGAQGGYMLAVHPRKLTVGEVLRLIEGQVAPVDCQLCGGGQECPLSAHCVFADLWNRAAEAIAAVYDSMTFEDLVREDIRLREGHVPDYSI